MGIKRKKWSFCTKIAKIQNSPVMLNKEQKRQKELLNYQKFVLKCDALRNISPINLRTIQRVAYSHAKTQSLGLDKDNPVKICFRLKNSKRTISILQLNEEYAKDVKYFDITWTDKKCDSLTVSAKTCKELMHKINHTYKLTKPTK